MNILSTQKKRVEFKRKEKRYKYIWLGMVIIISLSHMLNAFNEKEYVKTVAAIRFVRMIFLIVLITGTGILLLQMLKKRYNYEYKLQKSTIICFILIEIWFQFIEIGYACFHLFS